MNNVWYFRTPLKCLHGHFSFLHYGVARGRIVDSMYGEQTPECDCTASVLEACGKDQLMSDLRDKNGKPIYEGDILRLRSRGLVVCGRALQQGTVVYDASAFYFHGDEFRSLIGNVYPEMDREVIGHIYEKTVQAGKNKKLNYA